MAYTSADETAETPDEVLPAPGDAAVPDQRDTAEGTPESPRGQEVGNGRDPQRAAGPAWWRRKPTLRAAGPWLVVALLTLLYSLDSLARYGRFAADSWDLGIFTESVKQYAHLHAPIVDARAAGFDIIGEHFSPIVALLAPFFLVFPSPVTLLVAQSLLFALGAVPIIHLGRDRIGTGAGYAVGVAYGLSFGLAQAVDVDFHEIAFAVPVIAFSLCAFVRGQYRRAALWSLLLLLTKEDLGMTVVLPLGIAIILCGRTLLGVLTSAAGTLGTLLTIYWIIPAVNPSHTYEYWSKGGCADPTQQHGQPLSCLIGQTAANADAKFELVFLLLAITAFTALRSPIGLLAVPNLASRFMTDNASFWGTGWHYNAVLMPILFVAGTDAIIRARAAKPLAGPVWPVRRWARGVGTAMHRHGATAMLAAAVALVPQFAYGQFFTPGTFTFDARTAELRHAMSLVPDGTTVETTINMLAPLAAHHDAYWVGNPNPAVQYVVFDQGASGFSPPITNVLNFVESRHPGVTYQVVYSDAYGVYVLRRG